MKFILHFNRFEAAKGAKDIWVVRTCTKAIYCKKIICKVKIQTIYRGHKAPQPRAFIMGNATKISISKGVVTIV